MKLLFMLSSEEMLLKVCPCILKYLLAEQICPIYTAKQKGMLLVVHLGGKTKVADINVHQQVFLTFSNVLHLQNLSKRTAWALPLKKYMDKIQLYLSK